MALVDLVADEAAGHGTGGGRGLLAVAATDLVAEQATDHRADHGAADVAVTFRQAFLHRHVLADLVRGLGGGGLALDRCRSRWRRPSASR
jgi:hypothetical protein